MATTKTAVRDFWNEQSCGEKLLLPGIDKTGYQNQLEERYRLDPFIPEFAGFTDAKNREVLEIGVGLGADHQSFGQAGAIFHGVDVPSAVGAADNTLAVWFAVHDGTFIVGAVGEGKNDLTIFVDHNLIHGVFGIGTGISR